MEKLELISSFIFGTSRGLALLGLLFPFLSFIILMFNKSNKLVNIIAISAISISLLSSLFLLNLAIDGNTFILKTPWLTVGNIQLDISIHVDVFSVLMLVMVSFITLVIMVFSTEYMKGEKRYSIFFAYISLFIFAMFGLILSRNLLWMYIFWEMVGFCSYLLIGFYTQKQSAILANKKAFIINRIGDLGFLVGLMILLSTLGTLDLTELYARIIEHGVFVSSADSYLLHIVGYCFFIAVIAKSAQFPLHVWLPDAMEGPTPVSALIHAATMVISGVYLLIRIYFLLDPSVLNAIAIVGSFTAFMGAFIAGRQNDIKKILAYSTISQLGYMVMAVGVTAPMAAFYHLYTHAFFKAALFLGAGSIIHTIHTQDIREMGGLRKVMPYTFIVYLVASAALIGMPFFSGFFSKEAILNETWHWAQLHGNYYLVVPIFAFSGVVMTAFYVLRHVSIVFFGPPNAKFLKAKEPLAIVVPLILLSFGCLYIYPLYEEVHELSYMPYLTISLIAIGLGTAYFICYRRIIKPFSEQNLIYKLSENALYLDSIYNFLFTKPIHFILTKLQPVDFKFDNDIIHGLGNIVIHFSHFVNKFDVFVIDGIVNGVGKLGIQISMFIAWVDNAIIDGLVNSVAKLTKSFGDLIRAFQTGKVQSYFALSALLLVIFIWYFMRGV